MAATPAVSRRSVIVAGAATMAAASRANRPAGPLPVVATTSDLASLVAAVGGDLVHVRTLVPPQSDPEAFEPRASDLAMLSGAQLIVRVGLGQDFWLGPLLARMHGTAARPAAAPVVDASAGVPLLEVSGRDPLARDGHAHAMANPHYGLDPANAEAITANIAAAIVQLVPQAHDTVMAHRARFVARLRDGMAAWAKQLDPHRGAAVMAYHNSWPYFARRFRLNVVGFVEPKEGVAPSAAHLSSLMALARRARVRAILQKTNEPRRLCDIVSAQTGIPVALLAPGVGSVPQAGDYLGFMAYNVAAVADVLRASER